MTTIEATDDFKVEFRHAARRYHREVEKANRLEQKAEAARQIKRDCWQVDLAEALVRRAWERVSKCETRLTKLIESLTGGEPIPGVEVMNWSAEPGGAFPAVEVDGMIFALVGEERNFLVRPAALTVRLGD